jgi:hypothetical protein
LQAGASAPRPEDYGIYLAKDDWPVGNESASPTQVDLKLLFDDPDLVDAEPVAVYERKFTLRESGSEVSGPGTAPTELSLVSGNVYSGPVGQVLVTAVDAPTLMRDLPGQRTDTGNGPIFDSPPTGAIDHLRIYAARRDRFDDPVKPRVPGDWELILKIPIKNGVAATMVPTDTPTVLAGFDKAGHIVRWSTSAKDRRGSQATFFAYAGDHYSLAQPNGKHFCVGCHPGHSGFSLETHKHAESLP